MTQTRGTRIAIDYAAGEDVADHVGQPYTHVTFDGTALQGVTEVGTDGRLVVRFPDGRWAFATTVNARV